MTEVGRLTVMVVALEIWRERKLADPELDLSTAGNTPADSFKSAKAWSECVQQAMSVVQSLPITVK